MTTTLHAALDYASAGMAVFPINEIGVKGGEKRPHYGLPEMPKGEGGSMLATREHKQIFEWWSKWPDAQIGVRLDRSGLAVADCDIENIKGELVHGRDVLAAHIGVDNLDAESTLIMETPSGGLQLFYARGDVPPFQHTKVLPAFDILAKGYSILPSPASPSRSWMVEDGLDLDAAELDLMPAPEWMLALRRGDGEEREAGGTSDVPEQDLDWPEVIDIRQALACIPNDKETHYDIWRDLCFALKSTGDENAYELWAEWSRRSPKHREQECDRVWASAHPARAGSTISIETLFHMAKEHGYAGPRYDEVPVFTFGEKSGAEDERRKNPGAATSESSRHSCPDSGIQISPWQEVAELPPIEWQVRNLIPEASVSVLAGDTGAGKSFLAIELAMCLVHDLPFLGQPVRPGNVLYLAGEGQSGMAARFRAWRLANQHRGLDNEGRYCMVSSGIPTLNEKTLPTLTALADQVMDNQGESPDMIIVDTLSQGLEGDESDAKICAPVVRAFMGIRNARGCSVQVVHHLVKMQTQGKKAVRPTKDSVRGSGAWTRNTDTVLGLVLEEDGVERTLEVWKQKDGEIAPPTRVFLDPIETGETREDGEPETSCTMIPHCGYPSDSPRIAPEAKATQPEVDREEAAHEAIWMILDVLETHSAWEGEGSRGGMSGKLLATKCKTRRDAVYSGIEIAERDGQIKNIGTKSRPLWVISPEERAGGPGGGD